MSESQNPKGSSPKNSFSFSMRRFTVLVWLTCSKRLKRGRIPGGMKPIPWQDRLRSTCTCLLRDRTGDGYRLELDLLENGALQKLAQAVANPANAGDCRKHLRVQEQPLLMGDHVDVSRCWLKMRGAVSVFPGIPRIRFFLTSSLSSFSYGATTSFSLDFT